MKAAHRLGTLFKGAIGIALIGAMVGGWLLFTAGGILEILRIVADLVGPFNINNEGK